jgi:hypothetical protein
MTLPIAAMISRPTFRRPPAGQDAPWAIYCADGLDEALHRVYWTAVNPA